MTKNLIIVVLVLFLAVCIFSGCHAGKNKGEKASFKSVSMASGMKMMAESEDFVLLDVRRPDEYKGGHIPGALLLTNETMTLAKAEKLIPDKGKEVYVYCRSGRRSKEASRKLAEMGYTKVIEIGGILDYNGPLDK